MSKIFCFLGPSGVGKSSLQETLPFKLIVNYTTRPLRKEETNGVHVNHVSYDEFMKLKEMGSIMENTQYAGHYYGTPVESIYKFKLDKQPRHATLDINGINNLAKIVGRENLCVVYVKAPSVDVLKQRMKNRGDSEEKINERIAHIYSTGEIENEKFADYVIVNDNFDEASKTLTQILKIEIHNFNEFTDLIDPHLHCGLARFEKETGTNFMRLLNDKQYRAKTLLSGNSKADTDKDELILQEIYESIQMKTFNKE